MEIVADENIPCVAEMFGIYGTIRQVNGAELGPQDIREADALLVRSVTRVDAQLLDGSSVRFVGSATIGTDHIDVDYLRARKIEFAHAPGSNADSVADYVIAALLRLAIRRADRLKEKTVGVVGVGEIGGRLAERLPWFGCTVLRNDPPRQEAAHRSYQGNHGAEQRSYRGNQGAEQRRQKADPGMGDGDKFLPLSEVLRLADVVTLHVPLTREGRHSTFHLMDESRLAALKPGAWLVNTSRGAVVDNDALLRLMRNGGGPAGVVLDVWENEPEPAAELVRRVDLATPHVAGYAFEAKIRGATMIYQAFLKFLDHHPDQNEIERRTRSADIEGATIEGAAIEGAAIEGAAIEGAASEGAAAPCYRGLPRSILLGAPDPRLPEQEWNDLFVRTMYDIEHDHAALQAIARSGGVNRAEFNRLRRDYGLRREFASHWVAATMVPPERTLVIENGLKVDLV